MQSECYLRAKAVCARYGISKSTLYARMTNGGGFPKPIHMFGRCSAWKLSELISYEEGCIAHRDGIQVPGAAGASSKAVLTRCHADRDPRSSATAFRCRDHEASGVPEVSDEGWSF